MECPGSHVTKRNRPALAGSDGIFADHNMIRQRNPSSQTWRTFLDNHVKTMVSVDYFTVSTLRFQVLYVFLVLAHDRRRILYVGVRAHPTAE